MRSVARPHGIVALGCSVATLVALWVVPASANWQYTQWGMSPTAVKTASGGSAMDNADRELDADGLTAALTAPYKGSILPFTAVFLFDDTDGLRVVTLNPPRDRKICSAITEILRARYGPELSSGNLAKVKTARWQDYDNNNVVIFLDIGEGDCSIQYSKLLNTKNDGTL